MNQSPPVEKRSPTLGSVLLHGFGGFLTLGQGSTTATAWNRPPLYHKVRPEGSTHTSGNEASTMQAAPTLKKKNACQMFGFYDDRATLYFYFDGP